MGNPPWDSLQLVSEQTFLGPDFALPIHYYSHPQNSYEGADPFLPCSSSEQLSWSYQNQYFHIHSHDSYNSYEVHDGETEQHISTEPSLISNEQSIFDEILSLVRENIRRSEQFRSECEAHRKWTATSLDSPNIEFNGGSPASAALTESTCLLKASTDELDTKVTLDLTKNSSSESVIFPSSVVSFDLTCHDLDDGPPLKSDEENAIVLGSSGDHIFDKSPQQDKIGGVELGLVRRNEKTSENNGNQVFDESPQCNKTGGMFQYSCTQLQCLQNFDASFHVCEMDINGPIVKEELQSKIIFGDFSLCQTDGEDKVKTYEIEENSENNVDQVFDEFLQQEETEFLGELQSMKEMEEVSNEKIGSLFLDNMLKPSDESILISNIFSSVLFNPSVLSLGYNWNGIAAFEVPEDIDLNSNNGHLEAKHFVLGNEMSGDDYQYLNPSFIFEMVDSGKHEDEKRLIQFSISEFSFPTLRTRLI